MADNKKAVNNKADERGKRKTRQGKIVSDKMDKTVVVAVTRQVRHALYGKFVRQTNKFVAHDKKNECKVGDIVSIQECRPLSKTKRWQVVEVVERAE
jgi:small subunit ribosomal protein S17